MRQQLLKKYTVLVARTGQTPITLSFTPISGAVILLILVGVPLGWLGALLFSLFHNNVQLSQENRQLTEKAHEVLSQLDTLGSEIDVLRERAGISENESSVSAPNASFNRFAEQGFDVEQPDFERQGLDQDSDLSSSLPPRGGPATAADALSLYALADQRMPQLNQILDSRVKPALEETLAEEEARAAAYPDGKPVTIPLQVSSSYGLRSNPFGGYAYEMHEGIDLRGPYRTPIVATADGMVKKAGYNGGYGNSVTLAHGYGYETVYAHMADVAVTVGNTVKSGDIVGYLGSTGRSSGPHLHYGIYRDGKSVDPASYLNLENAMTLSEYWRLR
ncbi:MAG: M23 family metallopeptidase [Cyanobacteria bacterium P01_G01_bin.38]